MKKSLVRISMFIGGILLLTSLACNLPGSGPELPRIPVSERDAEALENQANQAIQDVLNGQTVTMTITEPELTSLVVYRLEQQASGLLSGSQVYLRDGKIRYEGMLKQSPLAAPVNAEFAVSAGADGRLAYEVLNASAGPFGMLQNMIDDLTSQFDQALYSSNSQLNDVFIENVTIADGIATITGRLR